MMKEILRLAEEYMKDTEHIRLNEEEVTLETIEQSYLVVEEREKFKHLCTFIRQNKVDNAQTIVFAATKSRADRIAHQLRRDNFSAIAIHGDLTQRQRDNAMSKFRRGIEDILVATDIAARGIDVPAVGNVINYDVPEEPDVYFHRIGRTARAGAVGRAISLVSAERTSDFERILERTKLPIRRLNDELGIAVPVAQPRIATVGGYHRPHGGHGYGGRGYGGNRGSGGQRRGGYGGRGYDGNRGSGGQRRGGYGHWRNRNQ
jgi:ATP-dependent RNA helicase DeaD